MSYSFDILWNTDQSSMSYDASRMAFRAPIQYKDVVLPV